MITTAGIAQLGERQTEDLKVACSIHAHRIFIFFSILQIVNTFPKTHYYHQIKKFIRQNALCDGLFGTGSHNDTHSNENLGYRALNVTIYGGISLGTYSRKYVAPLIFLSTCYHQALATVSADVSIWLEPVAKLQLLWDDHSDPRRDIWFCLNISLTLGNKEAPRLIPHFHNTLMSRQKNLKII
ncbi:hypothetical protein YC2023_027666 [Brassica napus]